MFYKPFSDLTGKSPHNVMSWHDGNIKTDQWNVIVMLLQHLWVCWVANAPQHVHKKEQLPFMFLPQDKQKKTSLCHYNRHDTVQSNKRLFYTAIRLLLDSHNSNESTQGWHDKYDDFWCGRTMKYLWHNDIMCFMDFFL